MDFSRAGFFFYVVFCRSLFVFFLLFSVVIVLSILQFLKTQWRSRKVQLIEDNVACFISPTMAVIAMLACITR